MEEGVAATVGVEPVLEVLPRADLVHGLVFDQLLEQRRGRGPGDALQLEEADIEPGRQASLQLAIERLEQRVFGDEAQQIRAQVDQELDALRNGVELGQDAQPARAHRGAQPGLGIPLCGRADRRLVGLVGARHLARVGAEFVRDQLQEGVAAGGVEAQVGLGKAAGALARRHLTAAAIRTFLQLDADPVKVVVLRRLAEMGGAGHQLANLGQPAGYQSCSRHRVLLPDST